MAEEDTSDLLKEVEQQLKRREHGSAANEVEAGISILEKRWQPPSPVTPYNISAH